jgi:hypothetical protein
LGFFIEIYLQKTAFHKGSSFKAKGSISRFLVAIHAKRRVNECNSKSIEMLIFLIEYGLSASLVGFLKTFKWLGKCSL